MYDYISLYSDENYSGKIKTEIFEKYLSEELNLTKIDSLKFVKEFNGVSIIITGIMADTDGSYSFDSLEGVEEINLIEIDVPDKIDDATEDEITRIAIEIAKNYSWCVFDHETSEKLYP